MQTNTAGQMKIKAGKHVLGFGYVGKANPRNYQFTLKMLKILFVWLAYSLVYSGELLQWKTVSKWVISCPVVFTTLNIFLNIWKSLYDIKIIVCLVLSIF